jgi:SAM-dependent methyltransferase
MPYHNPITPGTFETVLGLLPLGPDDRALDVGCGRGELLIRLAERFGLSGLGVDAAEEQVVAARARAAARVPGAGLRFEAVDAAALDEAAGSYALAACVGSTHAFGGLDETLARLRPLVRPDGLLLIGEGFWALPPTPAFLDSLGGASADDLTDYTGLLAAGERHYLSPVYATTVSVQDWEHYEWVNILRVDDYVRRHPDEAGIELLQARLASARRRRELAGAHGETLGFALLVWRLRR